MPCYSPLKGYKDPDTGGLTFRRKHKFSEKMEVACGSCLGCRLDYSRMWAVRIVHESTLHEHAGGNCFVTLTYRSLYECSDDQVDRRLYVPDDWSLNPGHFRNFMKRLRKWFAPQRIRYFQVGEYGRKCRHEIDLEQFSCPYCFLGRPHHHAALFNCSFPDLEVYDNRDGEYRYTSPLLEQIWGFGFVDVGELNYASAAYGARYILKKVNGVRAFDHYMQYDDNGCAYWLHPEYCTMSRGNAASKGKRCGIGADWFYEYREDVFPSDEVPVPGFGIVQKVPRYYEEIFKEERPLSMDEIKAVRRKFKEEHESEYTPERLMDKYRVKLAQVHQLKRDV